MSIQFKRLVLKNFLSFGPQPTEIDLRGNRITVVLGLNHDTGGDESRNGVGKSAIIDSISYVLFGKTIRGISNAKLVNKMARKGQGMLVVLEFDTSEGSYRVERGEAPSKMKLFRKDLDDPEEILKRDGKSFVYEVTRSKLETTNQIEEILGFDLKLFEYLIANSAESDAFMKLPEDKKREIAEKLMGLNLLTQRAEELKEERKERKRELVAADSALEATREANERIERQLAELEGKETEWEERRLRDIETLQKSIAELDGVDLEEQTEILTLIEELDKEAHRIGSERKEAKSALREAQRDLNDLQSEIDSSANRFHELGDQKKQIEAGTCPTCKQSWVADRSVLVAIQEEIDTLSDFSEEATGLLDTAEDAVKAAEQKLKEIDIEEGALNDTVEEVSGFELLFDDLTEVAKVDAKLETDREQLSVIEKADNPHSDTIKGLKEEALKEIDDNEVRDLRKLIDHYNYLIELLQSKDSFLRKAVIDRWLPRLNGRIAHYLGILELQYAVRIENDLTMSITDFGEEFDWGNLSKGQRQRVTIALNLAFQDLFEATNQPLSLLMVDELIDSGICNRGAGQAVQALREACESKDKRVFLITHRTDIADQIEDTMLVEMKNRVSRIEEDEEDGLEDA